MAKKGTTKTATKPSGEVEVAGQVIFVPLSRLTINAAIAAREGEPDSEKVERFAENFMERRSAGMPYQLSPALVRSEDGETFEIIDGTHRFKACSMAEEADKDNTYPLLCRVVQANDEHGLIDAIQSNEIREDPNDFDRASGIEKLMALGKTQAECATIFCMTEGNVSIIRRTGQLPAKFRKAVENGDLARDAAIIIAQLDDEDKMRDEVFDMAMRQKQQFIDLESRMETKRLRALADEKLAEAKQKVEEAKEEATAKKEERKAVKKDLDDVIKSAAKTKDVDELINIRTKEAQLKKQDDELAAAEAKATKEAEAATKAVEKAKAEKEKVKEQTAKPKSAVTAEDVKNAAASKGAKKGGKEVKAAAVTAKQLGVLLEALSESAKAKDEALPDSVTALFGKIQARIAGDISDVQLLNSFMYNCKTDDQLETLKKSKKKH